MFGMVIGVGLIISGLVAFYQGALEHRSFSFITTIQGQKTLSAMVDSAYIRGQESCKEHK